MSIEDQYLGFLHSKPLQEVEFLLDLPLFDFQELSTTLQKLEEAKIVIRENEVLGKRIEHFFEYSIVNSKRYDLISKNIQIFDNKITIGELDFIVKDLLKKEITHIELVYKFYLYDPNIDQELHRWVGPNRKDAFLYKVEKLKNHQFPLLYKKETSSILKELKLESHEIKQEVCFLANLFIPMSSKEKNISLSNNVMGYWIKHNEFTSEKFGAFQFFIPQKHDWVVNPKSNLVWFSYEDIIMHVNARLEQKKSPLLWVKRSEDTFDRFFIVWW
ncbi:DUF1853 family protein [Aquimarina gracilis]|uniref:DUF1853 family protein n=1 Tax=Aquimarina gracilis TaxID=874422 RepID=A0ABU5ZWG9_9FLAO|nr:DUF1853 family protein [Aquimarina gracilis]MEB3346200.1 DUF1853 family protein [Aquimarina gracilis]